MTDAPAVANTTTRETLVTTQAGQSFLERALDKTPSLVVALIGSLLGVSICFIAILQLGGLAVPVNNYLTAQLSPQVRSLETSISELRGIINRIEVLEAAKAAAEARLHGLDVAKTATETRLLGLDTKAGKNEVDIRDLDRRVNRIERRLGVAQ